MKEENQDQDFRRPDLHKPGVKEQHRVPGRIYKDRFNHGIKEDDQDQDQDQERSHEPGFIDQDHYDMVVKEENQDPDFTDQESSTSRGKKNTTQDRVFVYNHPDPPRTESAGPLDQHEYFAIWNEETEDELIKMIQERPALYDTADKCYVNHVSKTELWREMEHKLAIPGKEIKKRWKSLRTQYTRYIKLASSGRFGQRTERQQWILHHLQFLEPHTKRKESTFSPTIMEPLVAAADPDSPADSGSSSETSSTSVESCLSNPLDESNVCGVIRKGTSSQYSAPKTRVKRSRKMVDESATEVKLMRAISKTLKRLVSQDDRDDAISAYCRNFEHRMRQLPHHLLPHFQHEVDTCLYKYSVASDRH